MNRYHFCQVIYDGQQLSLEYKNGEEPGERWLTSCKLGNAEIIEWLNESTISSLEKLIAEHEKEQALDFAIRQAA